VEGMAVARETWLRRTVDDLRAEAVWLAGSLGRGEGDAWSDLDLLIVGGELPLDDAILTLEVPENGPVGGRYAGAMYDVGPLPLWVDWYDWPAGLPAPSDARLLAGAGEPGHRTLFEALDHHGRASGPGLVHRGRASGPATDHHSRAAGSTVDHRGRVAGTATDPAAFTLAMLPLTAKSLARGDAAAAAGMARMLGADGGPSIIGGLRKLLDATPASAIVRTRVGSVLDVVGVLTAPR
jgi:hypothetical protein